MSLLYCTQRLLDTVGSRHRGERPAADAMRTESRLGAWTATLLPLRPARFVVAVSEHGRLPLVIDALPRDTVSERLPEALYLLLLKLKLPPDLARLERMAMQPLETKPASDGGTLAILKIYVTELHAAWENGLSRSPPELSLHLARQSFEHREDVTPAQATRRRFHLLPDRTEPLGL